MGIFDDDDGDLFGSKKKPYSNFDKIGGHSGISDGMSGTNRYRTGGLNHGLSVGQQIAADDASNDIDALFVGKPKEKKRFW
ncbi:hypothetical protein [Phaeobacter inhibens]|uniref:hypothetical protein n=1 Tax=Phaeobacter inhibens TaxID=221822 RepID=UPI00076BB8C9|nr:hypothetical protein [Phaeobacter inhibens]KXF92378.1 hypothetical protein AT574_02405 [Phaeobacter inhibens]WHP67308.1 hypothetical protein QMZ01_12230 [Phaeobacter inhibens]